MSLLLQLNGDLPKYFPDDERRLHVFCCRKKTCSRKPGSIRALREAKRYKTDRSVGKKQEQEGVEQKKSKQDLGTVLFGSTSPTLGHSNPNPFSISTLNTSTALANPFSSIAPTSTLASKPPQIPVDSTEPPIQTFAQKLRISDAASSQPVTSPAEPWPPESSFPTPFPHYNIDADYETLTPKKTDPQPANGQSSKSQYEAEDTETDKDTADMTLDKTFQRFASRISQNPEQVLRYDFGGHPLLYSGTDTVAPRFVVPHNKAGAVQGMPRCENCGAGRVFELQLVPGLIEALESDAEIDFDEGMEWGTIILGVCSKNCAVAGEVAFREEWVGVQWEERVKYKK
jgi:pre-rRNA-processing protein TSR4